MSTTGLWVALLLSGLVALATKAVGWLVPARLLDHPWVAQVSGLVTVAMLAALVAVQTATSGRTVVLDARLAALAVAAVALWCRAPFVLVVVLAAVTAAGLRALGLA